MADFATLGIYALPDLAGSFSGPAIVAGSARCLWDDYACARQLAVFMGKPPPCIAVNDAIAYLEEVTHAYTDHVEYLRGWNLRRPGPRFPLLHTASTAPEAAGCIRWPWPRHGSSGLGATYTALALGYAPVILCGMPLDDGGHFFDPPWRHTPQLPAEIRYWQHAAERVFGGAVRSMSGRTRELLGGPTWENESIASSAA